MKKLYSFLAVLVLSCSLFVAPVVITGCAGGPNRVAYQSVGTAKVTVSEAMRIWGAYVSQQKAAGTPVSADKEARVASAYRQVQSSIAVVCDAGAVLAAATKNNPAGVSAAQAALSQAITDSAGTITDLENLIASFGAKLQ